MSSRDSDIKKELNTLVSVRRKVSKRSGITVRPPRDSQPATVGVGLLTSGSGSGSGIDSPLTETSRVSSTRTITDSTGVFSVEVAFPTQIVMKDSSDREVVFNYAQ